MIQKQIESKLLSAFEITSGYVNVSIVMDLNFLKFDKEEFIKDLSYLIAYPINNVQDPKFEEQCVFFNASIPKVTATRLLGIKKLKDSGDFEDYDGVIEFSEFKKKFNIVSISKI
jgi:hypothetical protein